jgi:hypothetical protein
MHRFVSLFFLLIAMSLHAAPPRVLAWDDDAQGFAWGSYRYMNATPKDIVVQMEQKAVKVSAGWKAVDLNLGGETRGIGAGVTLAKSIETVLYSAVWEYDAYERTLCVIVPGTDPRLGPIAFKAVLEDKIGYELDTKEEKKAIGAEATP